VRLAYSPSLGRFIQADTLVLGAGHLQSLNRYAYTLGNPVRYVDPSGHFPLIPVALVLGAAALLATGCTPSLPSVNESGPFLDVLERDFGLTVSPDFTPQERQWLSNAFEQYADFLGSRDLFVQVIIQQGGLKEITIDREGTTGLANQNGTLTLHDFSYVLGNGQPMYTLDETGKQEVAFSKLVWHETTHFLQFALPDSVNKYVELTPELNWQRQQRLYISNAPGSNRIEDYERMADALATTLYNQTFAPQYGISTADALPEAFRPWLQKQLRRH